MNFEVKFIDIFNRSDRCPIQFAIRRWCQTNSQIELSEMVMNSLD